MILVLDLILTRDNGRK